MKEIIQKPAVAVAPAKGKVAEVLAVQLPQAPTPPRVRVELTNLQVQVTDLQDQVEDLADPKTAEVKKTTNILLSLLDRKK
ncbi:MAG: hypothetical protein WC894_03140 [Patescibacteria group bacterium]